MFKNFGKFFRLNKYFISSPLLVGSLSALAYLSINNKKIRCDNDHKVQQKLSDLNRPAKMLKEIKEKVVCDSKALRQGQTICVQVQLPQSPDDKDNIYKILIVRIKGKVYGVSGFCSHSDPLQSKNHYEYTFEDAMVFGNKLLCPHHGCVFNIETGNVQFGPAYYSLARFFVQDKDEKITVFYPAIMPKRVRPQTQLRDLNDQKKVLILGNDHHATMGCIHGLRQYDYGGEINVVHSDGENSLPYRQELLHRIIPNLKDSFKTSRQSKIDEMLEQKVYSKLNFHDQDWFKIHGVEFHYINQMFRIINKRFYPFVKFLDGSKIEFDGILLAQGATPKIIAIDNVTYKEEESKLYQKKQIKLAPNTFMPYYNKLEHKRLIKFLNGGSISSLIVIGLNPQSLQFCESLHKSFPEIKVKVIDFDEQTQMSSIYGPDIQAEVVKEYIQKGFQFYVKMTEMPKINNFIEVTKEEKDAKKLKARVIVNLDGNNKLQADGIVYFPSEYIGNTEMIKDSKYVDIDYDKINSRVIVDPYSKTDTKRIFGAGSCSSLQFFHTRDRINLINPNTSYEQGFTSAFNMMALNIPYHYIPVEIHEFWGKKIFYAGARKKYDTMYIMGDTKNWDFITFYALDDDILAVSATPSRQKQFQVIRQTFRLQCCPDIQKIINGEWNIPKLYKLIRKIDKSACYKEEIHKIDPAENIPGIIWMQRDKGSFSSETSQDNSSVQINPQGYVTEL